MPGLSLATTLTGTDNSLRRIPLCPATPSALQPAHATGAQAGTTAGVGTGVGAGVGDHGHAVALAGEQAAGVATATTAEQAAGAHAEGTRWNRIPASEEAGRNRPIKAHATANKTRYFIKIFLLKETVKGASNESQCSKELVR